MGLRIILVNIKSNQRGPGEISGLFLYLKLIFKGGIHVSSSKTPFT